MKRGIVRLATTVLVSGGLCLAGLGLAAGAAQADQALLLGVPAAPLGPRTDWEISLNDW